MDKKEGKVAFLVYYDWETLFDTLNSNEEAGELIKALFAFAKRGEIAEFTGALKMAFVFMSQQIERDAEKWEGIRVARSLAGKKGAEQKQANQANATFAKQNKQKQANQAVTVTDDVTVTDYVTDVIYRADESANAPKTKRFTKPSLEEVKAYCAERNNKVNAEKFIDYYESNGWKVGKNSMKDWKAAVRNWEKSNFAKPDNKDYSKCQNDDFDVSKYESLMNRFDL